MAGTRDVHFFVFILRLLTRSFRLQRSQVTRNKTPLPAPSLTQTGRVGVERRPQKRGDACLIRLWVEEKQDINSRMGQSSVAKFAHTFQGDQPASIAVSSLATIAGRGE
jgi:hypothetical protein